VSARSAVGRVISGSVKYPMGLYRVGEMLLYTNRGIGMLSPRIRFLCQPEITAFTLYSR
jgi:predicted MPP superfamily phosphohydrolase